MAATVPLIWAAYDGSSKGSLAEAAAGSYDATFYNTAKGLIASNVPQQSVIPVRIGWEFNHNFQPWGIQPGATTRTDQTAAQLAADYVLAFRRAVTQFRQAATDANAAGRTVPVQFQIIWCMNNGDFDPRPAYPGNTWVDRIGTDFYWNGHVKETDGSTTNDPIKAWNGVKDRDWGVQFTADFAAGRIPLVDGGTAYVDNKPVIVAEWGVNNDAFGPFVTAAVAWASDPANNVESMAWWDSDAAYQSQVSTGTKPGLGSALRNAFNPTQYPTTTPVAQSQVPNTLRVPLISGVRQSGSVLTASKGVFGKIPSAWAYQWRRNASAIAGATASTYTLVDADVGQTITVAVTASNSVGAGAVAVSLSAGTIYPALTNNPDLTDYIANDITFPSDLTNAAWDKTGTLSAASGAYNLDLTASAQTLTEGTTSTTNFTVRRTNLTKPASTRLRKLLRADFKPNGRTFIKTQIATAAYGDGFNVFFDIANCTTSATATANADTIAGYAINRATAAPLANGFCRTEIDYYTDTATAGQVVAWTLVLNGNDFATHAGDTSKGVQVRYFAQVDATGSLVAQTAPPASTRPPIVWGADANNGTLLTAYPGAWSNQPTTYAYQWSANGTPITGATADRYTVIAGNAGQTFTVSVTATNNFGTGTAVNSQGTISDGIDYSQQWLTTVNNPTRLPPSDPAAAPAFGRLLPGTTNVASIDFTPAGNVNTRDALDAIAFYNSINGNLTQAIGSPMDDPSSGSSNCRARHYPAGHRYDLHTFNTEGLKLGVVGKNNGKTYTSGNCYAGGFRLEPEWKPGMSIEMVFKNGTSPFIWMPLWSFSGTQLSPNRIAAAAGNPYYIAANGAKLVNNTSLASNGRTDHFQYYEQDFGDFWTSKIYGTGKGLTGGIVAYQAGEYNSAEFKFRPYTSFLANDNGFTSNQTTTEASGYRYTSLAAGTLSDKFYTLTIDWPNDGSNIIRYILDGKVYQEQYQEFLVDSYADINGVIRKQAMHLMFGMQGVPSFAADVRDASTLITDREALSMTLKSIKIWNGNLDPASLTYPANAFPALLTPTLSGTTAHPGQQFSYKIGNKSRQKEGSTTYTASSDDGSPLSVSGATLIGTFSALGSRTVTITETPQPTSTKGLTVGYGGRPKSTTFTFNVVARPTLMVPYINSR